ncbi:MAG TPA: hypothetical protein DCS19_04185 [Flavobacterium sp.]|nr:hypothetical protein [Flavobacterium sp.]
MDLANYIFEIFVKVFAIIGGYGTVRYLIVYSKNRKEDQCMAEVKEHKEKHVKIDERLNQGDRKFDVINEQLCNIDKKIDDKFTEVDKKFDLIVKLIENR